LEESAVFPTIFAILTAKNRPFGGFFKFTFKKLI